MNVQVLLGICIYFIAMVAIGIYSSKRILNSSDFINAGRSLGYMLCSATLFASWFGGGTVIGASGAPYEEGFLGVITDPFAAVLALLVAGFLFFGPSENWGVQPLSVFMKCVTIRPSVFWPVYFKSSHTLAGQEL